MNIYDRYVEYLRSKNSGGTLHHVVPSALGGTDTIRCTVRQHAVLHYLLWRVMGREKNVHGKYSYWRAFTGAMTLVKSHGKMSDKAMGNTKFKGHHHTEESRKSIGDKQRGSLGNNFGNVHKQHHQWYMCEKNGVKKEMMKGHASRWGWNILYPTEIKSYR